MTIKIVIMASYRGEIYILSRSLIAIMNVTTNGQIRSKSKAIMKLHEEFSPLPLVKQEKVKRINMITIRVNAIEANINLVNLFISSHFSVCQRTIQKQACPLSLSYNQRQASCKASRFLRCARRACQGTAACFEEL